MCVMCMCERAWVYRVLTTVVRGDELWCDATMCRVEINQMCTAQHTDLHTIRQRCSCLLSTALPWERVYPAMNS